MIILVAAVASVFVRLLAVNPISGTAANKISQKLKGCFREVSNLLCSVFPDYCAFSFCIGNEKARV
jgi:hypothetical protein